MQIIPFKGGRIILPESPEDSEAFMRLSMVVKDFNMTTKPSKKQRKSLRQAWLHFEHVAGFVLPMTAGISRELVFDKSDDLK